MLVEEVDRLRLQASQRGIGDFVNVFRAAVGAASPRSIRRDVEAELGRDCDAVPKRRERLSHKFLVCERAVSFGGVEEGDAALDRRVQERDHFLPVARCVVDARHPHAA